MVLRYRSLAQYDNVTGHPAVNEQFRDEILDEFRATLGNFMDVGTFFVDLAATE